MKKQNIIQIIVAVLALLFMIGAVSLILGDLDLDTNLGGGGSETGTNDENTNNDAASGETVERSEGDALCAHAYDKGTIEKAATCKAEGLIVYTCTKCGKTREDALDISTEHTYGSPKQYNNNQHVIYCTVCDDSLYANHVLSDSVISATCISNGCTISECICGYEEVVNSGKLEHNFVSVSKVSGDSVNHSAFCNLCGLVYSVPHSYGAETVVAATCTSSGSKTKTCSDCGYVYYSSIPAIGHVLITTTVPATCTASGSKTSVCDNCDYKSVQTLPQTSHTMSCTSYDSKYHYMTCSVCGATETLGHSYVPGSVHTDLDGTKTRRYSCTGCAYYYTDVLTLPQPLE